MKTDISIKNIVIAAICRKVMNPEEWIYSKIHLANKSVEFDLENNEFPIFQISSPIAKTIITTRRIIERKNEIHIVCFEDISKISYGNFKGQINKSELSFFRIIDISGTSYDFQMETGKASIGLINAVDTVIRLKGLKPEKFII
ncbi:hypothetical protein L1276_002919 [Flavobacterium sp. HSC-32F16]|uniref:hypothetical protein n=1 Tax=Flavobacterium sp. HSC-32F16 TaxID=2910964 RepID=UPI0020A5C992|nr:hypothetical protein [Flavobacterium sp. HSC-32F16]MCP2027759.1 hypothetical protein [Flavobacterium sp. HSC-32F16]